MKKSVPALGRHVTCPFCEFLVTIFLADNMPWCGNCFVEWYRSRDGERIMFDDQRKTPRYAWAKALGRSGGARLSIKREDSP